MQRKKPQLDIKTWFQIPRRPRISCMTLRLSFLVYKMGLLMPITLDVKRPAVMRATQ